jgi:60s Acidic ribosomal protein
MLLIVRRPTNYKRSSRLPRLKMLNPSGAHFSPRYEGHCNGDNKPHYSADTWNLQALEGKDIKDLLLNVGSGGGAAAAPTAGGAASGGAAAAEETKEEEKEEGTVYPILYCYRANQTNKFYSKGGVRRRYGFRSFRLERFLSFLSVLTNAWPRSSLGATFGWSSSFP